MSGTDSPSSSGSSGSSAGEVGAELDAGFRVSNSVVVVVFFGFPIFVVGTDVGTGFGGTYCRGHQLHPSQGKQVKYRT